MTFGSQRWGASAHAARRHTHRPACPDTAKVVTASDTCVCRRRLHPDAALYFLPVPLSPPACVPPHTAAAAVHATTCGQRHSATHAHGHTHAHTHPLTMSHACVVRLACMHPCCSVALALAREYELAPHPCVCPLPVPSLLLPPGWWRYSSYAVLLAWRSWCARTTPNATPPLAQQRTCLKMSCLAWRSAAQNAAACAAAAPSHLPSISLVVS